MAMEYLAYLNSIIDDGIIAARADYADYSDRPAMLRGAVAGFEACRGLQPFEIAALLSRRQEQTRIAMGEAHNGLLTTDEYWEIRCFEAEVEWVANCVSAVLMNQGLPVIINPTARGMMKAADVVGVR